MSKWYEKAGRMAATAATGGLYEIPRYIGGGNAGRGVADILTLGGYSDSKNQSKAAKDTAKLQAEAAEKGMGLINAQTDKIYADNKPYADAGGYGLSSLMDYVKSGDAFKKPETQFSDFYKGSAPVYQDPGAFKAETFDYKSTPGYQNVQAEALKAAQNSAAAKGSLQSSSTIKNIQKTAGNIAADDYANEWNRFQTEQNQKRTQFEDDRNFGRNNFENDRTQENANKAFGYGQYRDAYQDTLNNISSKYSSLSSLANIGLDVAGNNQQASQQNMQAIVDLILQKANAQGAGVMGSAQAKANLVPNSLNRWGTVGQISGQAAQAGKAIMGGV